MNVNEMFDLIDRHGAGISADELRTLKMMVSVADHRKKRDEAFIAECKELLK